MGPYEKFWQRSLYGYLRCDPAEHVIVLTEPPMNTPENREFAAEIMFETFNAKGLHIGVSAVLALLTSGADIGEDIQTGTVIDSGDGGTYVVPVANGAVIGSCIRHIPLAGKDVTLFIQDLQGKPRENIPSEMRREVATAVKENFCYTCPDIVKEYKKFDKDPSKFEKYSFTHMVKGKANEYTIDVGYEQFLGPEIFFNPEMFNPDFSRPLTELIDEAITSAPIDCRKPLFAHICLAGGCTMFKGLNKRIQRDVKKMVEVRQKSINALHGTDAKPPTVKVKSHKMQKFASWIGGSLKAQQGEKFQPVSREKYEEYGPRIVRANAAFSQGL